MNLNIHKISNFLICFQFHFLTVFEKLAEGFGVVVFHSIGVFLKLGDDVGKLVDGAGELPGVLHKAAQITQADLDGNDYVFYMDSNNARNLRRMFPGQDKWQPFLSRDVADPWYTGDFTQTWQDIVEGCQRILEECNG